MQKVKTKFFEYGRTEIVYLKQVDKTLGAAIDRFGKVERMVIPDLFAALLYAVIGQQISVKAVYTIWDRMQERFGEITPENISSLSTSDIQQCGMTNRKAGYIHDIAVQVVQGELDLSKLHSLPDIEVIRQLSALRGIGIWTAEMLLLNSMERPNIVSWGDMAIRRGMKTLYELSDLSREQFNEYKNLYSPYGSVASIYLWKMASLSPGNE